MKKKENNFGVNQFKKEFLKSELEKIGNKNIQFLKNFVYFESQDFIPFLIRKEDNGLELILCGAKNAPQKTILLQHLDNKEIKQGIRKLTRGINKYDYVNTTELFIEYKKLKEMYKILVKLIRDMSRVIKDSE